MLRKTMRSRCFAKDGIPRRINCPIKEYTIHRRAFGNPEEVVVLLASGQNVTIAIISSCASFSLGKSVMQDLSTDQNNLQVLVHSTGPGAFLLA